MAEQYVGKIAEFKDGDRRIIFAGDNEIGIFRHEAVEELLKVAPRGWIGIFHNNHTATGVLNKDRDHPAAQTAFVDPSLDIISHFIRSLAIRADFKLLVVNAHNGLPM